MDTEIDTHTHTIASEGAGQRGRRPERKRERFKEAAWCVRARATDRGRWAEGARFCA